MPAFQLFLRSCVAIADAIIGERRRRLPHGDAHHRQAVLLRLVEDQLRDALDGRVAVQQIHRLAELLKRYDERIVVPQQHLVIELAVDPRLDDPLDVAEIAHHVPVIERARADLDLGGCIVSVRVLADAVVVEQAVTVAEVDALGNGIQLLISYLVNWSLQLAVDSLDYQIAK